MDIIRLVRVGIVVIAAIGLLDKGTGGNIGLNVSMILLGGLNIAYGVRDARLGKKREAALGIAVGMVVAIYELCNLHIF